MTYQLITIVGNVGRDAEIRYLKDGTAVADFSVAVSKITGRAETRQEKTTWFRVSIWRERAETAAQIVKKGAKILVTGEVAANSYVDKSGVTQVSLEVTCDTFRLLSPRADSQNSGEYAAEGGGNYNRGGGGGGNNYGRQGASVDDADEIPF